MKETDLLDGEVRYQRSIAYNLRVFLCVLSLFQNKITEIGLHGWLVGCEYKEFYEAIWPDSNSNEGINCFILL